MNIGTGEPARQMAKYANGRAESTYSVSDIVSPTFDASPNADPPAHTKRMFCYSNAVIAAGAAKCSVWFRIVAKLGFTFVLRRCDVWYFAQTAATPNALNFTRAYAPGGAFTGGVQNGNCFPIDGLQDLLGSSTAYGVAPIFTDITTNSSPGGATLWQFPIVRSANAAAMVSNTYTLDFPIVIPSSPTNPQDIVFAWEPDGNSTLNDQLHAHFYFEWYSRLFLPST